MESSRIFVKGLPPSLGEDEFRKHFSRQQGITDAKYFPQRRIGYVGYRSAEDAAKAIKYFNKSFINMSRIAVELARPATEVQTSRGRDVKPVTSTSDTRGYGDARESSDADNPLKRKRSQPMAKASDTKLTQYLDLMGRKKTGTALEQTDIAFPGPNSDDAVAVKLVHSGDVPENPSDDEYQQLKASRKRKIEGKTGSTAKESSRDLGVEVAETQDAIDHLAGELGQERTSVVETAEDDTAPPDNDNDWLRSRTSRLLGLLDEKEELEARTPHTTQHGRHDEHDGMSDASGDPHMHEEPQKSLAAEPSKLTTAVAEEEDVDPDESAIRTSRRLFLRNLAYDASEDDLRSHFAAFGDIEEVHVPIDLRTGKTKGLAFVQYLDPEPALTAFRECDGKTFQGRLLHIVPAAARRETKLDEYAISKLPLKKQQQIRKKAQAASSTFTWNSLYMNADAVISSVADRLGVDKSAVLDPTSSDSAVKQAVAETHVIQATKAYFLENGVDIEAFKRSTKGDTAILVKNFSYGTKADELRKLFEEHGQITRFLMPPSGTIAIVEFAQAPQTRSAFASLSYRKLRDSVLFLEKAPKDLFNRQAESSSADLVSAAPDSATDLLQSTGTVESIETTTLFVKNLNFETSSGRLAEVFKPLEGFMSARVKTKTNPKRPGETLSMGFGFLEFRSKVNAQAAIAAMHGYNLDGHQLAIQASNKSMDAAEERRREDKAQKSAAQRSKVIIKNLAFETTKKDVRALLKQYGQLRTVRVPKKFDSSARGFAFAEFTTAKEAANAIEALRNTHLLGRKLVMEYAAEDVEDAEAQLEKMQKKVGEQTNKVALQKLLGAGRAKFRAAEAGTDDVTADE